MAFLSVPVPLDGRCLLVEKIYKAQTPTKCLYLCQKSFYILIMTVLPVTTTLLWSDCPQQSLSQTTSDQCVWQPATVCSTVELTAGSLAGAPLEKEVNILSTNALLIRDNLFICHCDSDFISSQSHCHSPKLYRKWRCLLWGTDNATVSTEWAQSQTI